MWQILVDFQLAETNDQFVSCPVLIFSGNWNNKIFRDSNNGIQWSLDLMLNSVILNMKDLVEKSQ